MALLDEFQPAPAQPEVVARTASGSEYRLTFTHKGQPRVMESTSSFSLEVYPGRFERLRDCRTFSLHNVQVGSNGRLHLRFRPYPNQWAGLPHHFDQEPVVITTSPLANLSEVASFLQRMRITRAQ